MHAKFIVVSLLFIFLGSHVSASEYPVVLPLIISEDDLVSWSDYRRKHTRVEVQKIMLVENVKIIAVLIEVGSGIIQINTHVYVCENTKCELISYNVLNSREVVVKINYESDEMLIESREGEVLSRTKYQWIEWMRRKM